MTGRFYYAPRDARSGDKIVLSADESKHALRAMRLTQGAEIQIVDGEGAWFQTRICDIRRGIVTVEIVQTEKDVGEPNYELILGIGVLKNTGRFETVLEKAVELGVTTVIPLETERTQRSRLNRTRCERVMIAGMKQSKRSRLPEITEIRSLETMVGSEPIGALRLIAHESASREESILSCANRITRSTRCVILVGPEGGFTSAEVNMVVSRGWEQVSLGTSRMRTETAAIAALAAIHMIKSRYDGSD